MEFLPLMPNQSIKQRLMQSFQSATSISGCVAFWTIDERFFGNNSNTNNFLRLLNHENSFYCVDYSYPTDMGALNQYVAKGAKIYLHHYQNASAEYKEYSYLLHSKCFVLDFPDNKAEIWIGSHNFTKKALNGTNIEYSSVTQCKQTDDCYLSMQKYLDEVKKRCVLFDSNKISLYQAWQKDVFSEKQINDFVNTYYRSSEMVMNITTLSTVSLQIGDSILLAGTHKIEMKGLKNGDKLVVSVLNPTTQSENHFEAIIENSGFIDSKRLASYQIEFSDRYFAQKMYGNISYILPNKLQIINGTTLKLFAYFFNIKILNPINNINQTLLTLPAVSSLWERLDRVEIMQLFGEDMEGDIIKKAKDDENSLKSLTPQTVDLSKKGFKNELWDELIEAISRYSSLSRLDGDERQKMIEEAHKQFLLLRLELYPTQKDEFLQLATRRILAINKINKNFL